MLCLTLCDPIDYSPPDSSVHGISQTRILEWDAISFSRRSSRPRDRTCISCLAGGPFPTEPPRKPQMLLVQFSSVTQSCPTLCNPMNYSPPGSSVHEIFHAKILEWDAISFSRDYIFTLCQLGYFMRTYLFFIINYEISCHPCLQIKC